MSEPGPRTDAPRARARRIVVAPDGFKGTVSAAVAARELAAGWQSIDPDADLVLRPMADGGEGTLAAFEAAVAGARLMPVTVWGPRGEPHAASWLLLPPTETAPGTTAVVELASTAGIELFGSRLDPWHASTRGFGDAIRSALEHGVSRLVLAIGSSASTDGGAGMLAALGARFSGVDPGRALAANDLAAITRVDLGGLLPLPPGGVLVLTDVTSPLLGEAGAARVFGPQKGFEPGEIDAVESALRSYAHLLPADPETPGAGAAGGTGFGLLAWGATLSPGAPAVADLMGLPAAIGDADLVVTGEGRYDAQSGSGKAPAFVARVAADAGVPVALVAGSIDPGADAAGFAAVRSLSELAGSSSAAMADPRRWLRLAGAHLARVPVAVTGAEGRYSLHPTAVKTDRPGAAGE